MSIEMSPRNQPPPQYTISGHVVQKTSGNSVPGIRITVTDSNSDLVRNPLTDSNGNYAVTVTAGGSYTVMPLGITVGTHFDPGAAFYANVNSNITTNFTVTPIRTAYLIHGIGQGASAMQQIYRSLASLQGGVHLSRVQFDAGFDYSQCAAAGPSCPSNCSIFNGAHQLASYIAA